VLLRDAMPEARVWVHPAGLPHLVDPSRLVRSAARIYGDHMNDLWGEVAPVPRDRVIALADSARLRLAGHEVEILFTPGHAAHHVAARHLATGAVFTGDVAGVRAPGTALVSPPTVPPEFDLSAWEASIARLVVLEPPLILLGHFGPFSDVRGHFDTLRRRLREWTALVRAGLAAGRSVEDMGADLHDRDAAMPGATDAAMRQVDLTAGYAMSVAGIARYLEQQQKSA
jgi:glyoxylase-like metal-dependent hydrolase (beta-lactamase superfamily II)